MRYLLVPILAVEIICLFPRVQAQERQPFRLEDVFALKFASDPQISPDGQSIVYIYNFNDIEKDKGRSNLRMVTTDGNDQQPITDGPRNDSQPRWSPDGQRMSTQEVVPAMVRNLAT